VVEFDGYGLGLRKHKVRDFFRLVKAVEAESWTGHRFGWYTPF
jgi:hypothetical protein